MKHIGILIYPDIEELDFIGPLEVFDLTNRFVEERVDVFTISSKGWSIRGSHGLTVVPTYLMGKAPCIEVLVVPGGRGSLDQVSNHELLAFVADRAMECELVTSVCTGALILAAAGLLKGRQATTHHLAFEDLAAYDGVHVLRQRYVHDGKIVTAAGIAAGLDMALYVVTLLFDQGVARSVAEEMEYPFPVLV